MIQELKPMPGAEVLRGLGMLLFGVGVLWMIGGGIFRAPQRQSVTVSHTEPTRPPAEPLPSQKSATERNARLIIAPVEGWSERVYADPVLHLKITVDGDVDIRDEQNNLFKNGPQMTPPDVGRPKYLQYRSATGKPVTVTVRILPSN